MNKMDFDDNTELFQSFTSEGQDLLDQVEPQLIDLQDKAENDSQLDGEVLNSIFRMFHTIKGSAGFLELTNLQKVTHEAETILDLYRSGKLKPNPEHIRLLLHTCDFIRKILSNIEQYMNDKGFEIEAGEIVKNLTEAYSGKGKNTKISRKEKNTKISNSSSFETCSQPVEELSLKDDSQSDSSAATGSALILTITPEMVDQFVKESLDLLDTLEQALLDVEKTPENMEHIGISFRTLHTFKGNCGLLGYGDMEKLSHKCESLLEYMRSGEIKADIQTIRMILNIVDSLRDGVTDISKGGSGAVQGCNLLIEFLDDEIKGLTITTDIACDSGDTEKSISEDVQDLSEIEQESKSTVQIPEENEQQSDNDSPASSQTQVTKSSSPTTDGTSSTGQSAVRKDIRIDLDRVDKLLDLVGELSLASIMVIQNPDIRAISHRNFDRAAHHLDKIISEIQHVSMSLRMIPITGIFRKMIRLVHDLSFKAGKKVILKTVGEETEVDKTVADNISDPLVHIVRNSIDHGIEPPEEREKLGKNPTGTVFIEAKNEGGEVWIVVRDDGRGLNREKIIEKAISRGLINGDGSDLRDNEVFKFIFEPGFSTAEKITEISGRGVGMDVVNKNMEKLNGNVDVLSIRGVGTTITLRIPLTLATMDGMLVQVGASRYTIPLMSIHECIKPKAKEITVTMDGQEIVQVRGELLPVIRIHEIFKITPEHYELEEGHLIILQHHDQSFCIAVDRIIGQQQVVIKGLTEYLGNVRCVSGCTILGDGEVSLILDVGGLLEYASTNSFSNQVECQK